MARASSFAAPRGVVTIQPCASAERVGQRANEVKTASQAIEYLFFGKTEDLEGKS